MTSAGSGAARIADSAPHSDASDVASMVLARSVVRGLRGRMRHVVVSPGSRSAPMAYALAEAEHRGELSLHVRIDERSAAFTALGIALSRDEPVGMVTTSGTATGNLLPAMMEADLAGVPLVAITADRPEELHGTGANQTLQQQGMFTLRVRGEVHLEQPQAGQPGLVSPSRDHDDEHIARTVSGLLERAVYRRGPVHLNIGFRDPLVPQPAERPEEPAALAPQQAAEVSAEEPTGTAAEGGNHPSAAHHGTAPPGAERATEHVRTGARPGVDSDVAERRTLFVLGHGAPAEALEIAARSGQPVFAEPSAGDGRPLLGGVPGYLLLLGTPAGGPPAELLDAVERVVVVGRPTLTRAVAGLLRRTDAVVQYAQGTESWFDERLSRPRVSTPEELAEFAGKAPQKWLDTWQELGRRAQARLDEELAATPGLNSVHAAQVVARNVTTPLLLGSSSVIRDVDLAASPGPTSRNPVSPAPAAPSSAAPADDVRAGRQSSRVYALRGVSGIDGNVSAAAGIALGLGRRVTAMVGDLTFLHDVNALLLPVGEQRPELDIVVINDGGGAIFDQLEHGEVGRRPGWAQRVERLFGTPQDVGLAGLADAYGCAYAQATTAQELSALLREADTVSGRRMIEVRTDRAGLRGLHERLAGLSGGL